MNRKIWVCGWVSMLFAAAAGAAPPTATVADAVQMVRIQYSAAADGSAAAISPDGRSAAVVTWQGDLERDVNVFSLVVFDLRDGAAAKPRVVMKRDFGGDSNDQVASPIQQMTFLGDNRTIAFLGREGTAPAQVYTVDTVDGTVKQLTRHPTPVRSFVVGTDGALRMFSATAPAGDGSTRNKLDHDGVYMWDTNLFPLQLAFFSSASALIGSRVAEVRQYFLPAGDGSSKLFFDSRQSKPAKPLDFSDPKVAGAPTGSLQDEHALQGWATLTADPKARYILMFPYGLTEHPMNPQRYAYYQKMNAYANRVAAPYGLIDLTTGKIERLLDTPHPQFGREGGDALWTPDGKSVLIYTLFKNKPADPPRWVEVEIATRRVKPLESPAGWVPISWGEGGKTLILSKQGSFATLRRDGGGRWGKLTELGRAQGFNDNWSVATNGRVVVGVKDALTTAPEIALYDLSSKQTRIVSDFNPQLRERSYGAVETFHWKTAQEGSAEGFLIRPVGYQPGKRYPLIVLLDDGTLRREGEPYLLDAAWQLSGHAIQMLAAQGFMVLYPREPQMRDVMETSEEGVRMRNHIESAVAELERQGSIDPKRVGLSGWSRAGFYTHYLLVHSSIPFAAASAIDGGAREYLDGMRPFTDEELKRVRTPALFESHGLATLVSHSTMADRLSALGKATEILYFATASHSTTQPQHRMRSLGTHIDWWRFWLKGEEDADPAKNAQYAHWRKLREIQDRVAAATQ